MTERIRIPRKLATPIHLFGRFTPRDLLRIGLPILTAATLLQPQPTPTNIAGAAAAAVTAATWYLVRPAGQTLDTHLYHSLRYTATQLLNTSNNTIETRETHVKTNDGSAVAVIKVEPTNLGMKTSDEQKALHTIYRNLLASVTYPIQIHSRQTPLEFNDYINNIDTQQHQNRLRTGYLRLLQKIADSGHNHTQHYITVRAHPSEQKQLLTDTNNDNNQLADDLDQRTTEIIEALDTSELNTRRLTGQQLNNTAQKLHNPNPQTTHKHNSQPHNGNGEYSQTLAISELPTDLDIGWTLNLLRSNARVDITQTIKPCKPSDATQKLNRASEQLQAEINSLLRQGYLSTNKLESTLEDAEWMLDLLAQRKDNPVHYAAYITIHHPDKQQCAQALEQVQNRCNTMRIQTHRPILQTDKALATWQPLQPDQLNHTQLMPARSAAAGFPFGTQSINQTNGVLHGTDTSDQTPVILDRFQWSSHSMARMGMVGSGKSYATKLEILRSHLAYPNLKIHIIDPKNEYADIARALNGQAHTLQPGKTQPQNLPIHTHQTNAYQVQNRGQRENTELLAKLVEHLYQRVSQTQQPTLVVIDEARILMNDEQGRQLLNQFVLEGRDTNTAITLISQNASHFTHCREGREILDNMPGKVFMKHDRVPQSVVDYFDLSTREKQQLHELRTGTNAPHSEALVRVSGQLNTKIKIESTPEEHGLIGGNT
jgi:hypothetical protein